MKIPDKASLNKNTIRESYIKKHYNDFYRYLLESYPNNISFIEKLYWYYNNIKELPKCKNCGSNCSFVSFKKGYSMYCSNKCANNSNETKEKSKATIIKKYGSWSNYCKTMQENLKETINEKYGVDCVLQLEDVKQKIKDTFLKRYGVDSYTKTSDYKIKSKQTCLERYGVDSYTKTSDYVNKSKQTKLERYGDEKFVNIEKAKQTNIERYGVDNFSKTYAYKLIMQSKQNEIQHKIFLTKKKNHTFNSSLIETQFKQYLNDNNIEYKYQYKSDKYPFYCDFYFPQHDLYLEINAYWTHGFKPFENNAHDIEMLEKWKSKHTDFYNSAIKTWTVGDVKKRETAKTNNLNYLEVFSNNINDVITAFNQFIIN